MTAQRVYLPASPEPGPCNSGKYPIMERFFEFIVNHTGLVSIWLALLAALIWTESRKGGKTVSPQRATFLINRENALVVDVRDRNAFNGGHITGALNIPLTQVQDRLGELEAHRERPIILACNVGQQSAAAGKILHAKGFPNVHRLAGGINEWRGANFPLVRKEKTADGGKSGQKGKKGKKGKQATGAGDPA